MNDEKKIDLVAPGQAYEILFEALDYETDDARHAFVEEACLGDAALRQEVHCLFESLAASEAIFEDASHLMIPAQDLVDTLSNLLNDSGS